MPLNVALATEILARITADPDVHEQIYWVGDDEGFDPDPNVCSTPHCVAGWALAYDGYPIKSLSKVTHTGIGMGFQKTTKKGKIKYVWREIKNEREIPIRARKALGLTIAQAQYLFFRTTDEQARAFLAQLVAEALRVESGEWDSTPTTRFVEERYRADGVQFFYDEDDVEFTTL